MLQKLLFFLTKNRNRDADMEGKRKRVSSCISTDDIFLGLRLSASKCVKFLQKFRKIRSFSSSIFKSKNGGKIHRNFNYISNK